MWGYIHKKYTHTSIQNCCVNGAAAFLFLCYGFWPTNKANRALFLYVLLLQRYVGISFESGWCMSVAPSMSLLSWNLKTVDQFRVVQVHWFIALHCRLKQASSDQWFYLCLALFFFCGLMFRSILSLPRKLSVEFEEALLTTLLLKVNVVRCVLCTL